MGDETLNQPLRGENQAIDKRDYAEQLRSFDFGKIDIEKFKAGAIEQLKEMDASNGGTVGTFDRKDITSLLSKMPSELLKQAGIDPDKMSEASAVKDMVQLHKHLREIGTPGEISDLLGMAGKTDPFAKGTILGEVFPDKVSDLVLKDVKALTTGPVSVPAGQKDGADLIPK